MGLALKLFTHGFYMSPTAIFQSLERTTFLMSGKGCNFINSLKLARTTQRKLLLLKHLRTHNIPSL
jgi:hypothetical protein